MYQYEIASGHNIEPLVKLARKHRLFVPGWTFSLQFRMWDNNPELIMVNDRMVLAYHNELPIGVAIYTLNNNRAMVFVRQQHRRNKVGTNMVNMIAEQVGEFDYDYGNRASLFFWNAIEVERQKMINNELYVLNVHPINTAFAILQSGDDVWVGEDVNGEYEYVAGYWPANSTGVALATDILNNINV